MGYAPGLSSPRGPISVLAPNIPGGIPGANAKVLVLPIYLPITGEGWPKATRHENDCLLDRQNMDYHCHCPPKKPDKFQKTGSTVTHSLQVVYSLLWNQPSKAERTRLCSSPLHAYHSHTHTLPGVVLEDLTGSSGPPVTKQENTALLSRCRLAGTSQHVSLLGLGGKECSVCVHSV